VEKDLEDLEAWNWWKIVQDQKRWNSDGGKNS